MTALDHIRVGGAAIRGLRTWPRDAEGDDPDSSVVSCGAEARKARVCDRVRKNHEQDDDTGGAIGTGGSNNRHGRPGEGNLLAGEEHMILDVAGEIRDQGGRAGLTTQASQEICVELRGVTHRYGRTEAVRNITLRIRKGEFFSLLGPSGCGKTTTLKVIGGFVEPTEGDVFIDGRRQTHLPPYKRDVNTVFQNYALFPHMSVTENVAFGLKMKGVATDEIAKRVEDTLTLVALHELHDRRPAQLSGGQQQRVALARALVNEPLVLLLDEPLGSLDLKLRKQMQLELSRLQRTVGITFIYVTHDQEEALSMSDRIALMREGVIEQVDTPEGLYEHPRSRFVADFIGFSNFLDGTVEKCQPHAGGNLIGVSVGGLGLIWTVSGRPLNPGEPVTLVVRPEKIGLAETPPPDMPNCFAGKLEKVAYLGSVAHYYLELPDARQIVAYQQNTLTSQARPSIRKEVFVWWSAESTQILDREITRA